MAELDGLRRVDDHEYISFTSLQAVELFIRHVNPKHAAAACSSTFFVNHPEIAIQLSPKSMVVSETGSHPFAVRSSTRSVSYILDALSPGAKTCYLEILGVSAEPALKFVEEYYRWPKLFRNHSRLMGLGRWACLFRDANNVAYSKSAIHITLDHGRVLEQHRGQVKRAKTRFINATLDWLTVATRIYERAREFPDAAGAKYIALAMAAPGFHRHLRRLQSGFTVVLPKSESGFREVVKRIERHPAAKELLRRFLFLHVVAGQLPIVPGHAIFLTYSDAADDFPKAFVVDPHTVALGAGLWGKTISPLQWVWEKVFSLKADIDYSYLTWSMLDPLHGTSELVLDHSVSTDATADVETLHNEVAGVDPPNGVLPADCTLHNEMAGADPPVGVLPADCTLHNEVAGVDPPNGVLPADCGSTGPDDDHALVRRAGLHIVTEGASHVAFTARSIANVGIVKAYDFATKLPLTGRSARLVRYLYRKGRGRPRLSIEDAGLNPPVLRLAGPEARESPAEPELSISRQPPLTESARASYDAISKLNIADNVAKITLAFYERLGLNPQQSPAYRCLASIRSKLAEEVEAQSAIPTQSSLERFELAWRAYEAGRIHEALQLFGEVIADQQLAEASAADPRAREAFVRAAEILGRHAELRGDADAAAQLYRRILELDGSGIVARRLLLMLWREARIQEAAELAPRVVLSDGNLALHLRGSDAVNDLARRLGCESRREATTARCRNARDVGLPDRCAARTPDDLEQAYR